MVVQSHIKIPVMELRTQLLEEWGAWIGVAPDGIVGINENGHWVLRGHYDDLKN